MFVYVWNETSSYHIGKWFGRTNVANKAGRRRKFLDVTIATINRNDRSINKKTAPNLNNDKP